MKIMDLQNSLLKYKAPLAFFVACCILLCNLGIGAVQSHTAETYIKFLGENAIEGLTPDGKYPLNPYEMTNASVIANAMDRVGELGDNNLNIIEGLTITPVVPYAEEEKYNSWIDSFDDYENSEENKAFDVYYRVRFTSKKGPEHARKVLKALLEEYKSFYVEKYGYESDVIELSDKAVLGYDYFESAQLLEAKIENDIEYFTNLSENDGNYRSPSTGYTASDIVSMYTNLRDTVLASVYNNILEGGIARDAETLVANLRTTADEAGMDRDRNNQKAETQIELMQVYSKKNKNYLWDAKRSDDESEQVREDTERDYVHSLDKSVYDSMMLEYSNLATSAANSDIDEKYNNKYAKNFLSTADTEDAGIQAALEDVCSKLNTIHDVAEATIKDYNYYKSAKFIQSVTGISVSKTMGEMICYAATVVISLGLGIVVIIVKELKKKGKI